MRDNGGNNQNAGGNIGANDLGQRRGVGPDGEGNKPEKKTGKKDSAGKKPSPDAQRAGTDAATRTRGQTD